MLLYLFQTVGSLAKTTGYERQFTENRHLPTDYQTSHRSTREALTRRAQLVCDSPYSLQDRTDFLNNIFSRDNYNADSNRQNTHSNANSKTKTNFNSGPTSSPGPFPQKWMFFEGKALGTRLGNEQGKLIERVNI